MNQRLIRTFGVGVVLCAATKLRLGPLGLGEVLMLLSSQLGMVTALRRPHQIDLPHGAWLAYRWFWSWVTPLLIVGSIWSALIGVWDAGSFVHDTFAFIFNFLVISGFLLICRSPAQWHDFARTLVITSVWFGIANILFYLAGTALLPPTSAWQERYFTLSENPNQLALYYCVMPFLLLYSYRRRLLRLSRLQFSIMLLIIVYNGYLTHSDALILAWEGCFSGLLLIGLFQRTLLTNPGRDLHLKALLVLVGVGAMASAYTSLKASTQAVYETGDQGSERVLRWLNSGVAILRSPVFGLGPGSFSGSLPFTQGEAHNTYLDWMMSSGLIGLGLLLIFQLYVVRSLVVGRAFTLLAGIVAMLIFGMFHYIIRHPIFWLNLLMAYSLATANAVKPDKLPLSVTA